VRGTWWSRGGGGGGRKKGARQKAWTSAQVGTIEGGSMVPTLVVRILSRPTDAEAVDQFRGPLQWRKSNGSNKAHRRQYMVVCSDLREFGSAAFGYGGCML
jgi:hypothetical protein